MTAWNKVELGTWKFEKENDSIEGIFIKAEQDVGQNKSMLYHLEVEGKPLAVWGSVVLDTKMTVVKPNDKIKIVYLGKGVQKGGKNAPKLFDVFIEKK
jgi:hypothetical protein